MQIGRWHIGKKRHCKLSSEKDLLETRVPDSESIPAASQVGRVLTTGAQFVTNAHLNLIKRAQQVASPRLCVIYDLSFYFKGL